MDPSVRVAPNRPAYRLASSVVLAVGLLVVVSACEETTPTEETALACDGDSTAFAQQMAAYADTDGYAVAVEAEGGQVTAVTLDVPPIEFTGEGTSATLPAGPCQHIYRYAYLPVDDPEVETPFEYVEIDWNTEGEPRGPKGSFSSAHFDFHFYLQPREWVEAEMQCETSNGKTCNPELNPYAVTRRFQLLPEPDALPPMYRPDIESAIPAMGLHVLDYSQDYTVEAVDHYPVLIYGTFDGEVVFLEASVTLQTLQDARAAPDHRVSFPVGQPAAFPADRWPQSFDVVHDEATGGFTVGFSGFRAV